MQTAVDCNGSTSSSTITTNSSISSGSGSSSHSHNSSSTTINSASTSSSSAGSAAPATMTQSEHEMATPTPTPTPQLPPHSVLRHRLTASHAETKTPKNGLTHLIDAAAAHLGSNVECLPPDSPQGSPHKRSQRKLDALNLRQLGSLEKAPSKTTTNSSNANSATTVMPRRNGNVYGREQESGNKAKVAAITAPDGDDGSLGIGDGDGGGGGDAATLTFRECSKQLQQQQQQQPILTNQMLPFENTSSLAIKQELSSGPSLLATKSSPTTSSMATSPSRGSSSSSSSSPTGSLASSSSTSSALTPSLHSPASTTTTMSTTPTPSTTGSSVCSNLNSASSASTPMGNANAVTSAPAIRKDFAISGLVEAELLQWQDMPQYLQFNPYVLKGYRPLQTFKGCLLSLFYWHNETINILTHAIPIVYILAIVPGLMPWESEYRFLSFCHVFGSVAPWCGSFVYHLFMNIERGENVYYTLLKLDMVGIWVSQSFGALPLVTATTFCFSPKWKWLIIVSYCLLSLWGLYKALTASSPWQRRLCFALPFTMRSILTFFRTLGLVGGNQIALSHVYLQDAVSITGGAIGAMRIPEKWFPGLVDFYLNSHNIMHVLVVTAVYSMHKATIKDFEWMSTANCEVFTNVTSKVLESTLDANTEL